jgi:hypothetical protein
MNSQAFDTTNKSNEKILYTKPLQQEHTSERPTQPLSVLGVPSSPGTATVSAAQANGGSTAFDGTTLTLETLAAFNSQIIGFAGDATLAGSDKIDLRDISFNSVHSSFDSSKGTLAVSDGTTTANLQFLGTYDNFKFADDGRGGT